MLHTKPYLVYKEPTCIFFLQLFCCCNLHTVPDGNLLNLLGNPRLKAPEMISSQLWKTWHVKMTCKDQFLEFICWYLHLYLLTQFHIFTIYKYLFSFHWITVFCNQAFDIFRNIYTYFTCNVVMSLHFTCLKRILKSCKYSSRRILLKNFYEAPKTPKCIQQT